MNVLNAAEVMTSEPNIACPSSKYTSKPLILGQTMYSPTLFTSYNLNLGLPL